MAARTKRKRTTRKNASRKNVKANLAIAAHPIEDVAVAAAIRDAVVAARQTRLLTKTTALATIRWITTMPAANKPVRTKTREARTAAKSHKRSAAAAVEVASVDVRPTAEMATATIRSRTKRPPAPIPTAMRVHQHHDHHVFDRRKTTTWAMKTKAMRVVPSDSARRKRPHRIHLPMHPGTQPRLASASLMIGLRKAAGRKIALRASQNPLQINEFSVTLHRVLKIKRVNRPPLAMLNHRPLPLPLRPKLQ